MPKRRYRVFVSHTRRGAHLAADIARELRKHKVEPLDVVESIGPGEDLRRAVKSAIRRADAFVVMLTAPEAAASSWIGYELGMAEALGKPILLLLSHNHSTSQLPDDMAGLRTVAFNTAQPGQAAREIVERLLAAA
jgi:nucleoside 2-deoxyribosyltransferase